MNTNNTIASMMTMTMDKTVLCRMDSNETLNKTTELSKEEIQLKNHKKISECRLTIRENIIKQHHEQQGIPFSKQIAEENNCTKHIYLDANRLENKRLCIMEFHKDRRPKEIIIQPPITQQITIPRVLRYRRIFSNKFKEWLKMKPSTFDSILNHLKCTGTEKLPIENEINQLELELAVTLEFLQNKLDSSTKHPSSEFQQNFGELQAICIPRMIFLLLKQRNKFVYWPSIETRERTSKRMYWKFKLGNCIGVIGSIFFPIKQDILDPFYYSSKLGKHGIFAHIICDDEGVILDYVVGFPGCFSSKDAKQFMVPLKFGFRFFTGKQYLFGSNDYPSSKFLLNPSTFYSLDIDDKQKQKVDITGVQRIFDQLVSALMGRWASMQFIHDDTRYIEHMNLRIESCFILHNMMFETTQNPS